MNKKEKKTIKELIEIKEDNNFENWGFHKTDRDEFYKVLEEIDKLKSVIKYNKSMNSLEIIQVYMKVPSGKLVNSYDINFNRKMIVREGRLLVGVDKNTIRALTS